MSVHENPRAQDSKKVAIVGVGMVGMSFAYAMLNQNICDELCLIDINKERAIILVSHDIGTVLQNVKSIACVNGTLDYHPDTEIPTEWLEEHFGCPIELLGHGNLPHRVLKSHHHD